MICKSFEVVLEELNIGHELPWCDSPWRNIQIYQSTAFTLLNNEKEAVKNTVLDAQRTP